MSPIEGFIRKCEKRYKFNWPTTDLSDVPCFPIVRITPLMHLSFCNWFVIYRLKCPSSHKQWVRIIDKKYNLEKRYARSIWTIGEISRQLTVSVFLGKSHLKGAQQPSPISNFYPSVKNPAYQSIPGIRWTAPSRLRCPKTAEDPYLHGMFFAQLTVIVIQNV